jgi:zinc protease
MRPLHTLLALVASLALSACCWSAVKKHPPETSGDVAVAEPEGDGWPAMPVPGPAPEFNAPVPESFTLSNGLPVTLVRAGAVPLLRLQLNIYSGTADDPDGKSGVAAFTADMLNEGTKTRTALEISDQLQTLASGVAMGADLDYSDASLDALESTFDASLELFSDLVRNPTFPEEDLARVRADRRNRLLTRQDQIANVAFDVFKGLLFGDTYAGRNGGGTPDQLDAITRDDVLAWYGSAWRPSNAGVVIVTRLEREAVLPLLEKHLGTWEDSDAPVIEEREPAPAPKSGRTIYWVDRPGSSQSFVIVGNTAPGFDADVSSARNLGNHPLGGQFTSRINMNLREDKGYTYGARSRFMVWDRAGAFATWASVKTATTAASLTEFLSELDGVFGDRPVTADEFSKSQSAMLQGYAGRFEGISGILGQFAAADAHRRPDGWVAGYNGRVSAVTAESAAAAFADVVSPTDMAIVIVGDWNAAGADVAALGVAEVTFLDETGQPAEAPAPPAEDPAPPAEEPTE